MAMKSDFYSRRLPTDHLIYLLSISRKVYVSYVKFHLILGPLGPKFDRFYANRTTKMTLGTFGLWMVPNVPSVIFMVLFVRKPSNLGPNRPNIS